MKSRGFVLTLAALLLVLASIALVNNQSQAQQSIAEKKSEVQAVRVLDDRFKGFEEPVRRLTAGDNRRRDVSQRLIPFEYKISGKELTIYSLVNLTDNDPLLDSTHLFFNTVNFYRAFIRDANITNGFVNDVNTPKNRAWNGASDNFELHLSIWGTCTQMVIRQIRDGTGDGNRAEIWFELDPKQIRRDELQYCMTSANFPDAEIATVWQKYVQDVNVYYVVYSDYAKSPNDGIEYEYQLQQGGDVSCHDPSFAYDPARSNVSVAFVDADKNPIPGNPIGNSQTFSFDPNAFDPDTGGFMQCGFGLYKTQAPPDNLPDFWNGRGVFRVDTGMFVDNNFSSLRFLHVYAPMEDGDVLGNGAAVIKIRFRQPIEEMLISEVRVHAQDPAHGFNR